MEPPRKPQGITPHAHFLQDVCDSIRANRILSGVGYRVKESPAGTVLEIPRQSSQPWFHPFKIYLSGYSVRTRGGYVGVRSRNGQFNNPAATNGFPFSGNGETIVQISSGADGVVDGLTVHDYWTPSTIQAAAITVEEITVANTGDFGVSTPGNAATFTLNTDPDGDGAIYAGLWIEIADDTQPIGEIKCRMWSENAGSTGRSLVPWPYPYGDHTGAPSISGYTNPDKIIIPIGIVGPRNPVSPVITDLVPDQFISEHQVRRYKPGCVNPDGLGGHLGPTYWRGLWDDGDTENLADTYFYDGETVSIVDGDGVTSLWVHIGIASESDPPPGSNWRLMAGPA